MNIYQDKSGFYHDHPVVYGLESSDNGIYYTAIAHKLGVIKSLSPEQIVILRNCFANRTRLITPHRPQIPLSRDEAMALEYFGFHFPGWSFSPEPLPKFNLWLTLVQFFHLVDPHTGEQAYRTKFWREKYTQVYRFAYSFPLSDRHYILKLRGKYNPLWHLVHIIAHFGKEERRSQRQLAWFRTGKDIHAVANYFPKDHPFQLEIRKRHEP